ncbi:DNA methyltransferase [Mucilaginibacter kameinonensis]|uniref:DNA methyltransferase n=1 Tax=Mucilaginibacter kameinonensis TaxID=452286 RepID=UPI000EF7EC52|nr:DNA methyltransferase [Mucilaginibacter kameinonensis]
MYGIKEDLDVAYRTDLGIYYKCSIENALQSKSFEKYKGKINLIITSPPFPLNRKKKYGNFNGQTYIDWLTSITSQFAELLTDDGSFVIEIGNAWEENEPTMSTLPLETLLEIKRKGDFKLCEQFVWFNTAKLPSPVQWVNIERSRVKDSFTNIWWLSKTAKPKANNKNVLEAYSASMEKLLKNKKYNSGARPSEHHIGDKSFLSNHGGSIPSNVLIGSNTVSNSAYLKYCQNNDLTPHPARMPNFIPEFFTKFLTEEYLAILFTYELGKSELKLELLAKLREE